MKFEALMFNILQDGTKKIKQLSIRNNRNIQSACSGIDSQKQCSFYLKTLEFSHL